MHRRAPEPLRAALRATTALLLLAAVAALAGCPIRRRPPPWQRAAAQPAPAGEEAPPASDPAGPAPADPPNADDRVAALASEVVTLEQRWAIASSGPLDAAEREALLTQIDRLQSEAFALQEVSQDDALYAALDALTVLRDAVVRAR